MERFDRHVHQLGYVYLALADHIARLIAQGELAPGTRLPNERSLAEQHGVAIGTVRRATAELRARGLVTTIQARGTFVLPYRSDPSTRSEV
ncbi:winged helix-turn-helix domain-containing protein [Phytoactinopolyspora halotolerans]|uniref:Winged helix-turn-helix transcriptional regulator n=1 Tax=Phytoactinopolyspora halotolerans TaxID=1981512 RepID=A0A6L9SB34_9ACTN|nr:winged helix-turn-helix domain-containing protein [Phytoactinopolyspora halotolerans]NEE01210.1 winged helix-turn-helix transcriptional regulator [Phytoactinopolyspora halotolerans]